MHLKIHTHISSTSIPQKVTPIKGRATFRKCDKLTYLFRETLPHIGYLNKRLFYNLKSDKYLSVYFISKKTKNFNKIDVFICRHDEIITLYYLPIHRQIWLVSNMTLWNLFLWEKGLIFLDTLQILCLLPGNMSDLFQDKHLVSFATLLESFSPLQWKPKRYCIVTHFKVKTYWYLRRVNPRLRISIKVLSFSNSSRLKAPLRTARKLIFF